jgi:hypothetical protein
MGSVLGRKRSVVPTLINVAEAPNGAASLLKITTADRPGLLVDIVRVLKVGCRGQHDSGSSRCHIGHADDRLGMEQVYPWLQQLILCPAPPVCAGHQPERGVSRGGHRRQ